MEIRTEKQIKKQEFINLTQKKRKGGCRRTLQVSISSCLTNLQLRRLWPLLCQPSTSPPSAPGRLCTHQLTDWGQGKQTLDSVVRFCSSSCIALYVNFEPQHRAVGSTKNPARNWLSNTQKAPLKTLLYPNALHLLGADLKGGRILGKSRSSLIEELVMVEYEIMEKKPRTENEENRSGSKSKTDGCRRYCVEDKQI